MNHGIGESGYGVLYGHEIRIPHLARIGPIMISLRRRA